MSGDTGGSGERPPGSPSHPHPRPRPRPQPQPQLPRISSSPYSRILQANQYPAGSSQQMGSQQNLFRPSNNLEIMSPLARTLSQPVPFPLDPLYPSGTGTEQWRSSTSTSSSSNSYSLLQPSHFVPSGSCYGIGAANFHAHRSRGSTSSEHQPSGSINVPWRSPGGLDTLAQVVNTTDPVRERDNMNAEMVMGKSKMVQVEEDVFSAFMDLDYMDAPTPSATAGNTTTTTSTAPNEVQGDKMIGVEDENSSADEMWRSAFEIRSPAADVSSSMPAEMGERVVEDVISSDQQMNLHLRSVSDDSFLENTDLADDFLDLPPYPAGTQPAAQIISSMISTSSQSNPNGSGLTLGGVSFTGDDLNKILENPRLSEMALRDPRRAKRILSNRRSAARSKERKLKYVAELEQRIATLQNERTMLASQLAQLEQEAAALANQNNELKFRLQAMEQQGHLQEALKAALAEELQRLRLEREPCASSSGINIHQSELSENKETGEMQRPTEPQESKDDEATPSAEDEPKQ